MLWYENSANILLFSINLYTMPIYNAKFIGFHTTSIRQERCMFNRIYVRRVDCPIYKLTKLVSIEVIRRRRRKKVSQKKRKAHGSHCVLTGTRGYCHLCTVWMNIEWKSVLASLNFMKEMVTVIFAKSFWFIACSPNSCFFCLNVGAKWITYNMVMIWF